MTKTILIAISVIFLSIGMAGAVERDDITSVRFQTADVFIDSGGRHLAAWQVEVRYDRKRTAIVGLEGGTGAFKEPPYYDPKGMETGRIIIAAFTTDDTLAPKGKNRVARLHLRIIGETRPQLTISLITAAEPGGNRIKAVPTREFGDQEEKNHNEHSK